MERTDRLRSPHQREPAMNIREAWGALFEFRQDVSQMNAARNLALVSHVDACDRRLWTEKEQLRFCGQKGWFCDEAREIQGLGYQSQPLWSDEEVRWLDDGGAV